MLFLLIIILYLLISGVLTLIERKLIALFQSRVSNYKFNLFGILQFFMDFIKLINKNLFRSYCIKSLRSIIGVLVYYTSNMLFVVILFSIIYYKNFYFLDLIILFIISCINLVSKIFCFYYLKSDFLKSYINRIKVILLLIESLSSTMDFIIILILSSINLNSYLIGGFSFNFIKCLIFIFFILSVIKSFRSPFDNLERESEVLNNLYIKVDSLEYSLWTLLEYISILNNIFFYIIILKTTLGFSLFNLFNFFILYIILVCILRAISVRVKFSLFIYFLLSVNLIFIFSLILLLI